METEQMSQGMRIRGRRRSFSQMSNDVTSKELGEQSGAEEEEFCVVNKVKGDHLSVWENERGYQENIVHFRLTQILINRAERLNWQSLIKDIDFSEDPGPIQLPAFCLDVAQLAEEGILTDSEEVLKKEYVDSARYHCNDAPCSSRSCVSKNYVDPESDAEALKTDYEDTDAEGDVSTEKVVEDLLHHFQQLANNAEKQKELVSIMPDSSLLNLPGCIADEVFKVDDKKFRLRGKAIWAPPKKKFICDLAETREQQAQLSLQNSRCAGCGMQLTKFYSRRAKLCAYYNKLFCQCCFVGEKAMIPARILHQWNFKEYAVCDLAYSFLTERQDEPVYNVRAVNPDLFKKVKNLKKTRKLRIKASHMWQYIRLCRESALTMTKYGNLKTMFGSIPKRFILFEEVDVYSITDFVNVESGGSIEMLEPIVECGKIHIEGCLECQQRAFLCQICINPNEFLFSFQLDKVYQCDNCGALSHLSCYKKLAKKEYWQCSRCERIRRKKIVQRQPSITTTERHSD